MGTQGREIYIAHMSALKSLLWLNIITMCEPSLSPQYYTCKMALTA